ncbi:MAG: adenosylcobinamide-GDP ribazoletransferase [Myxococcota bacterium]
MSRSWRALGPLYDLLVALQFLTRFPVPRDLDPDQEALGRAAVAFPVVGAVVGGVLALTSLGLERAPWSEPIQVALLLVLGILCTGAFHEDGLADSFDGLWGGFAREDVLRIMRDSRVGTYGALALVMVVVLRGASLLGTSREVWALGLVVAHVCSRTTSLWMLRAFPYARATRAPGVAKPLIEGLTWGRLARGMLVALALVFFADGVRGACMLLGACAGAAVLGVYVMRRLGGITGDTLGGVNVLCELGVLLAYAWAHPAAGV